MKKLILMALAGLTFLSAEAQTNTQGCKIVKSKKTYRHHHDKFAENYPVCKDNYQYYICGEAITYKNSTKPDRMDIQGLQMQYVSTASDQDNDQQTAQQSAMIAPQSQSYPSAMAVNTISAYEGYYPVHRMTVTYGDDNVADMNRAPYEGLPSPAYDGPDKNKERNLNESNPNADLAPITGRRD